MAAKTGRARTKSDEAPFDEVQALHDLEDAFLECRDLRHRWEVVAYYRHEGNIERLLHCARCDTDRIDTWTKDGERLSNRYRKPEGYDFKGVGVGGVNRVQVRREVVRRAEIFRSEKAMVDAMTGSKRKK